MPPVTPSRRSDPETPAVCVEREFSRRPVERQLVQKIAVFDCTEPVGEEITRRRDPQERGAEHQKRGIERPAVERDQPLKPCHSLPEPFEHLLFGCRRKRDEPVCGLRRGTLRVFIPDDPPSGFRVQHRNGDRPRRQGGEAHPAEDFTRILPLPHAPGGVFRLFRRPLRGRERLDIEDDFRDLPLHAAPLSRRS